MAAPFVGHADVVGLGHALLQKLTEQVPAQFLLLRIQAAPQLGPVLVHKQESWLLGSQMAFRQLHRVVLFWMQSLPQRTSVTHRASGTSRAATRRRCADALPCA